VMEVDPEETVVVMTIKHQKELFQVDIEENKSILELKLKLSGLISLPEERIRLICCGRLLKDSELITPIYNDATVYLVKAAENSTTPIEPSSSSSKKSLSSSLPVNLSMDQQKIMKAMIKSPMFKVILKVSLGFL